MTFVKFTTPSGQHVAVNPDSIDAYEDFAPPGDKPGARIAANGVWIYVSETPAEIATKLG